MRVGADVELPWRQEASGRASRRESVADALESVGLADAPVEADVQAGGGTDEGTVSRTDPPPSR
ncbi:hypothetical protein ACFYO5_13710 [Streptomyces sp. NPDC006259]|uniref:hypothetical protein n=1 Tax=Streptomyces sp. NPDC006259 TaxID=3364740 RepID=UPI0036C5F751